MIDIKEVKKALAKTKSRFFKNANSYSIGMLKSKVRGTGLQFKEHQVYSHGDDVRFIDWKMLAKTSSPYVKTFEEERNVEIIVVLEITPTMLAGDQGISKLQAAIELCCMLYLMTDKTGDLVHLMIVADEISELPKMRGEKGMGIMLDLLKRKGFIKDDLSINYNKVIELEEIAAEKLDLRLNKLLYKKKEVVILSDFLGQIRGKAITNLARHSHVQCFRLIAQIDESSTLPYSILSRSIGSNANVFNRTHLGNDLEKHALQHVTPIRLQKGHLSEFIREMA